MQPDGRVSGNGGQDPGEPPSDYLCGVLIEQVRGRPQHAAQPPAITDLGQAYIQVEPDRRLPGG